MSTIGDCVFCRIAHGHIKHHVIAEEPAFVAVTDIAPLRPGHTQIISKLHAPYFEALPQDVIVPIVTFGQRLAAAMKRVYGVPRLAFLFTGGDIAHTHAHVVPMHEKTDITSRLYIAQEELTFRDVPRASEAVLEATATAIRAALGSHPPSGDR